MLLLLLLLSFLLVLNCPTVARVIIMITLVITLGDAIEIRIWMNHHVESNLVLYVSHVFFGIWKKATILWGSMFFWQKPALSLSAPVDVSRNEPKKQGISHEFCPQIPTFCTKRCARWRLLMRVDRQHRTSSSSKKNWTADDGNYNTN